MYDLKMWIHDPYIYLRLLDDVFMRIFTYIYCRNIHIYGIVDPISYDKRTFCYKIT